MPNKKTFLNDDNLIKRAFISTFAVETVSNYLKNIGIDLSSEISLHLNPLIAQKFDISDIRLKNSVVVDVRAIVGEEYPQMCIPREHFDRGMAADIYVGLKIAPGVEEAEIAGFVKSEGLPLNKGSENYYILGAEELQPIDDIATTINSIAKKGKTFYALDHEKALGLFIPFIDNGIADNDLDYLLEHLHNCAECREKLNSLISLDSVLKNEKQNLLLEEDYTLRLLISDPVLTTDEEVTIAVAKEQEEQLEFEQPLEEAVILGSDELPESNILEGLEEKDLTEENLVQSPAFDEPEDKTAQNDAEKTFEDVETIDGKDIELLLVMFEEENTPHLKAEQSEKNKEDDNIVQIAKIFEIRDEHCQIEKKQEEPADFSDEKRLLEAEEVREDELMHFLEEEWQPEKRPAISEEPLTDDERRQQAAQERIKWIISFAVKNKKMVAGSIGAAVCLIILLSSIGKLSEVVSFNKTDRNSKQAVNELNNQIAAIKRERTPIKTYSREIVKVVKPEIPIEIPENIIEQETEFYKKPVVEKPKELKIKHISWELPANVAREQQIKDYFVDVGQKLETTLSKKLYDPEFSAENLQINIYIELNSSGKLAASRVTETSGVEKIDNICLSTINALVNKHKFPGSAIKQDKIKFSLLIRT